MIEKKHNNCNPCVMETPIALLQQETKIMTVKLNEHIEEFKEFKVELFDKLDKNYCKKWVENVIIWIVVSFGSLMVMGIGVIIIFFLRIYFKS